MTSATPDVAHVLAVEDFGIEKHRRIYARIKDLFDRGENIDRVTVGEELIRHGELESVDGLSYLVSLDVGIPEIANLDSYLRIVKEKSILRQTMIVCERIMGQCALASEPSQEVLRTATTLLDGIRGQSDQPSEQWVTPGGILQRDAASVLFPSQGSAGIRTPWPHLTEMTSGWNLGDLIIVAGRPGMGKSVIGMQQAHTSAREEIAVAYFSLEMSKESLVRRLVAGVSRVDSHKARSGFLSAADRGRMIEAASSLENLPLFISAPGAYTAAAISSSLRRLTAKSPVRLIIVDHLQLMKVSGRPESRHHELSEICHTFKRLAVQMQAVVVLLSQLNRSCEQERRLPSLSDLKESGSIEEDADVVVFIHRPELYRRDDPGLRGKAELVVAKQRNGPTGKLPMTFLAGLQVFEEAARPDEEAA